MILKCVDHGEGLQVLHYEEGSKSMNFVDKLNTKNVEAPSPIG